MVEGARKPAKRLLATGRKINGTWEVRTFLRLGAANAAAGNETFWERWRWRGTRPSIAVEIAARSARRGGVVGRRCRARPSETPHGGRLARVVDDR